MDDLLIESTSIPGAKCLITWSYISNSSPLYIALNTDYKKIISVTFVTNNFSNGDSNEVPLEFLDSNELLKEAFIVDVVRDEISTGYLVFTDDTYQVYVSNVVHCQGLDVPEAVDFLNHSNILQPGDNNLVLHLSEQYLLNSSSDGGSQINLAYVFVQKLHPQPQPFQGVLDETPFIKKYIININGNYNNTYIIGDVGDLLNNHTYEVTIRLLNDLGLSPNSGTKLIAPKNIPGPCVSIDAIALVSYETNNNTPHTNNNGDRYVSWTAPTDNSALIAQGYPVISYTLTEQRVDEAGAPIVGLLHSTLQPVVLDVNDLQNGLNYTFIGSQNDLGNHYKYSVFPTNANGSGEAIDSIIVRAIKQSSAPTVSLNRTFNGNNVSKTMKLVLSDIDDGYSTLKSNGPNIVVLVEVLRNNSRIGLGQVELTPNGNDYEILTDGLYVTNGVLSNTSSGGSTLLDDLLLSGSEVSVNASVVTNDTFSSTENIGLPSAPVSRCVQFSPPPVEVLAAYSLDSNGNTYDSPNVRFEFEQLSNQSLTDVGVRELTSVIYKIYRNDNYTDLSFAHDPAETLISMDFSVPEYGNSIFFTVEVHYVAADGYSHNVMSIESNTVISLSQPNAPTVSLNRTFNGNNVSKTMKIVLSDIDDGHAILKSNGPNIVVLVEVLRNNATIASGEVELTPNGNDYEILTSDLYVVNGVLSNTSLGGSTLLDDLLLPGSEVSVNASVVVIVPDSSVEFNGLQSAPASRYVQFTPSPVDILVAYTLDSNGNTYDTPIVRLVFEQLSNQSLTDVGVLELSDVTYNIYRNGSYAGLSLAHDPNLIQLSIDVPVAYFGYDAILSVQTTYVTEDNYTDSVLSDSAQLEKSITKPLDPENAVYTNISNSGSVDISWINPSHIYNPNYEPRQSQKCMVLLYKDTSENTYQFIDSNDNLALNYGHMSTSFSQLEMGSKYVAIIFVYFEYSNNHSSGNSLPSFYNFRIYNQNAISVPFRMAVAALAPTNIEIKAKSASAEIYFDPPEGLESCGLSSTDLLYGALATSDLTDNISGLEAIVTNLSAATVVLSSAYNAGRTVQNMVNDGYYTIYVRSDAYITDELSFETVNISSTDRPLGLMDGFDVSTPITYTPNRTITMTILGTPGIVSNVYTGIGPSHPILVSSAPRNSVLSLSFTLPINATEFELWPKDNDVVNSNGNPILPFNTNSLGGLAYINTPYTSSDGQYNLTKQRINNEDVYTSTINNLVNNTDYEFSVYAMNAQGLYSDPLVIESTIGDFTPTGISNPAFLVDALSNNPANNDGTINVSWTAATSASPNQLSYKLEVFSGAGTLLFTYTTQSTNWIFQNLQKVVFYDVIISAVYTDNFGNTVSGPSVHANSVSPNLIYVDKAPILNTLVVTPQNNSIYVEITNPDQSMLDGFPIDSYGIYIKSTNPNGNDDSVLVTTITGSITGVGGQTVGYTINDLQQNQTIGGSNLIMNGYDYTLEVRPVVSYTYAQPPSSVSASCVPYGYLSIVNVTRVGGEVTAQINCNGRPDLIHVVGVAKSNNNMFIKLLANQELVSHNSYGGSRTSVLNSGNIATVSIHFDGVGSGAISDLFLAAANTVSSCKYLFPENNPFVSPVPVPDI